MIRSENTCLQTLFFIIEWRIKNKLIIILRNFIDLALQKGRFSCTKQKLYWISTTFSFVSGLNSLRISCQNYTFFVYHYRLTTTKTLHVLISNEYGQLDLFFVRSGFLRKADSGCGLRYKLPDPKNGRQNNCSNCANVEPSTLKALNNYYKLFSNHT